MPRGITEDDVWKACDALLLEGARPTIERVRLKCGRGSPNTVSPMLETWFKHLGTRITDPGAFAAPVGQPDVVRQAAQHLWEVSQAEARRDVDDRVKEGLAIAATNVEAEKEKSAVAEAAAFSANSKAAHMQTQVIELQAALEAERIRHASTLARADAAEQQCASLQAAVSEARQAVAAERGRADQAIAQADERAGGAERRAALEIERERGLRTKAEKATESIAKRFEASLKAEISANEQLSTAQARLAAQEAAAAQREQELRSRVNQREVKLQELETALSLAQQSVARSTTQEALVKKIFAELGSTGRRGQGAETVPASRSSKGTGAKSKA
jgi:hypothetical protein